MTKCGSWIGSSSRKRTVSKNLRKPEYSMCLVAQSCLTLCDPMDCSPPGTSVHGDSSGRNTGVGCHALLRGAFNQGLNPGLPHCRQIPYHLSLQRSPRILEWVTYPFSKRSSQPGNWTRVSCIAGGFFTTWATRKARGNIWNTFIPLGIFWDITEIIWLLKHNSGHYSGPQ